MSSFNPYSEDELDNLVRDALQARVSGQEPSDRVWERIKTEMEADKSPPPRELRLSWPPIAVQVALTLLLVMFGSLGLQTLLSSGSEGGLSRDIASSGTGIYLEEGSASPPIAMLQDMAELRSLKARLRPRPTSEPDAESNSRPPIWVPRDAPPNALVREGPVLKSEPSLSLVVKEQNAPRSGPYPWYR